MSSDQRFKIFSDPVHGFISVPKNLILDLIQTPEVQRLRRIRQLGVGHLVFPGAEHTRFNHALGAMALMQDALSSLSEKGTPISPEEQTSALAAALLHDVGHGAFSHTLEHELISEFEHEDMSRVLLLELNERLDGALDRTLAIFDDTYERPFFHQLVSSQLDMDRLDYLRRDSFYTGVAEGEVGVQRLIKTMRVHPLDGESNSEIMIEGKGIYAVENFLISRRLMYWQVYLHKTVLAGDELLRGILHRAKEHLNGGSAPDWLRRGSRSLLFFLEHDVHAEQIDQSPVRDHYLQLDDTDILFSLKQWIQGDDPLLADLCRRFINRRFFRVTFLPHEPNAPQVEDWRQQVADWLVAQNLAARDEAWDAARHYLTVDVSRHTAYDSNQEMIGILDREGNVRELSEMADTAAISELTTFVVKPYVCYPKPVAIDVDAVPTG
ncbi:HD family phosphohydrolase [Salinibacter sp. 10B]|uniref:HD domain-containing protein n=1 Tax=Salinibacter sp. 10B TaxID=1923971 RepID=UPI000CF3F4C7|nr:HD domain-containing protein [Salinibacter sp. 10B]PQJ33668.1 HD family phosphohydrolase [Salinibacter sp. 10B]